MHLVRWRPRATDGWFQGISVVLRTSTVSIVGPCLNLCVKAGQSVRLGQRERGWGKLVSQSSPVELSVPLSCQQIGWERSTPGRWSGFLSLLIQMLTSSKNTLTKHPEQCLTRYLDMKSSWHIELNHLSLYLWYQASIYRILPQSIMFNWNFQFLLSRLVLKEQASFSSPFSWFNLCYFYW